MAYTSFGVNDAFAVKLWAKDLAVAERQYLPIAPLIGKSANSIIQLKPQTSSSAGDKVTFGLRARLSQDGVTEGQVAEGNGEQLSIYSDAVVINELGGVVGVKSKNTIDQQRVPFGLREHARDGLAEWWGDRLSYWFFAQVCGNTAQSDLRYTGHNTPTAPTSNRRLWAAAQTADENLNSGHTFTLDLIDKAVELARVGDDKQRVRPIRIGGEEKFVVYLHPKQVTSMRTNTSTAQWFDIQRAAMQGGKVSGNPIYTGALGEYNSCILRSSQDVAQGVNSSSGAQIATVRRAVLLGAQAAVCAYGQQGGSIDRYRWNEELLDHKRKLEVSAWAIAGLKKTVFNSQDFGAVTMATYA